MGLIKRLPEGGRPNRDREREEEAEEKRRSRRERERRRHCVAVGLKNERRSEAAIMSSKDAKRYFNNNTKKGKRQTQTQEPNERADAGA